MHVKIFLDFYRDSKWLAYSNFHENHSVDSSKGALSRRVIGITKYWIFVNVNKKYDKACYTLWISEYTT